MPAAAPVVPLASGAQLLDTFEPDRMSTASSNEFHANGTTPATTASIDTPSEETQLETLSEASGWNEVPKGKKGKKKTNGEAADSTPAENKSEITSVPSTSSSSKPSKPAKAPTVNQQQPVTNGYAALHVEQPSQKGHPDDSDWL